MSSDLAHVDNAITETERLLKIFQVARMANVSESTVRKDIKAGRLLAIERIIRVRRRIRVPLSAAKAYATAHG